MKNCLPNCTGPVVKAEKLNKDGTLIKQKRLTMYVYLHHRQSRSLLVLTEDIEQLTRSLVFRTDIG